LTSARSSRKIDDQLSVAQPDLVRVLERNPGHFIVVNPGSGRAFQLLEHELAVVIQDPGVISGHLFILELDVVVMFPPDGHGHRQQGDLLAGLVSGSNNQIGKWDEGIFGFTPDRFDPGHQFFFGC
jgi:hypothetical protein